MNESLETYNDSIQTPGIDDRYVGIRVLWIKVIIRAVFDWVSYRDSTKLAQRKLAEQAWTWLFKPSMLFTGFENVCRMINCQPETFRAWASSISKVQVAKMEHLERDHSVSMAKRLLLRESSEEDEEEEDEDD